MIAGFGEKKTLKTLNVVTAISEIQTAHFRGFENDVNVLNDIDIIIVELHKKIYQDIEKIFFSFAKDRYNISFDSEKLVSIKKK